MKQIIHILKYKILSYIKSNTVFKFNDLIKNVGGGIIYVAFAYGAFIFSWELVNYLLIELRIGMFLLHEFISIILFIFFVTVNIGNIIVSYSTLYKSQEAIYLITKPVHPTKIFIIKFLDNFFYSSSTFIFIVLSALAGYAVYFGLDIIKTIFIILFNFIPFMLSAASLGVIFLLIIIKIASRYGLKRVLYSLGAGYVLIVFMFFRVTSPVKLANEVMKYYPNIDRYFGELIPETIKYIPNNWLSELMYWMVQGNFTSALPYFFFQILLCTVLLTIALYLGHKWYFSTWLLSLKIQTKIRTERKIRNKFFIFEKVSSLKAKTEAILKRDFHLFTREPSQIIHFAVLMFLILIFISSISGLTLLGRGNFLIKTTIFLVVFLFNALLISTLSLRFVFPLLSLEGFAFWKVRTAPISNKDIIKLKLLPPFLFIMFISLMLSLFSNRRFPIELVTMGCLLSMFVTIAMVFLNFGMGGLFAVYKEKNPIRVASSQGASISFLLNLVYMVFLIAVLFFPISRFFESKMFRTGFRVSELFTPLIIVALVSVIIAALFYRLGLHSLKKDF
ncbi:MAG: hypothetical protein A2V66_07600 [Ignavibacteria bacterium RBG_13_36_8]|nr:MAG: hypothetical protein A2V66_07600 [Ignavibacteria bacterium RBG_13_36_8]